jgi:diguanylate cyclase (GGDEF)-like protein
MALAGVAASAAALRLWPSTVDARAFVVIGVLAVAAGASARLSFRTSSNHLVAAPTAVYVVCAAVLVGPLGALAVGIVAGAIWLRSPRAAQVFSSSLAAIHAAVAAAVCAQFAAAPRSYLLGECAAAAIAGGFVWVAGQAAMYRARQISMHRLWRVETPSTLGEVAVAVGAAPAIILVYRDAGIAPVALFAALLIASFAAFRAYRTRLLDLHAEVERLSRSDPLTGAANRRAFGERLDHECRRLARSGMPFALLLIDLDRFKQINDTYGHAAGDYVLQKLTSRMHSRLRQEDLLARFGGDEFAVISSGVNDATDLEALASALTDIASDGLVYEGRAVGVGASIGAVLAVGAETVDELLRRADVALYDAKASGRNRYAIT